MVEKQIRIMRLAGSTRDQQGCQGLILHTALQLCRRGVGLVQVVHAGSVHGANRVRGPATYNSKI